MVAWTPRGIRSLLRPKSTRGGFKQVTRVVGGVLTILLLVLITAVSWVGRTPVERSAPPLIVNDVTQLNPILVGEVITPTITEEIVEAVKQHRGPIAIGGARSSMGGQTATEGALHMARKPRQTTSTKTAITASPPTKPVSSQITAKMKSERLSGR